MRHHGQDGRRHRDGVTPQNKFHNAVRNGQSSETSLWHALCQNEVSVNEEVDLSDPDSEKSGNHQSRHIPDAGVGERYSKTKSHPFPHERWNLNKELKHTADKHADGQRNGRLFEVMPNRSYGEYDDG